MNVFELLENVNEGLPTVLSPLIMQNTLKFLFINLYWKFIPNKEESGKKECKMFLFDTIVFLYSQIYEFSATHPILFFFQNLLI